MGYKQNNPLPMMKSAMKMMKAERKAGMHRDSAMYMNSPMYSGHSPMEMGHESPAKKYDSPMHKEESRELKDMPIVDIEKGDAKGDRKDARKEQPKSKREYGSPAKAAKPDYIDIDGDGDKSESMKEAAKDKKKGSPAEMNKKRRVYSGGRKLPKGPKDKSGSPAKMKKEKDEKSGKGKKIKLKDLQSKEGSGPRVGDVKPGTIKPTGGSPYKDKKKKGSPAKKYDRVVLGGNKGDKSKTKPGKKDYEK